MATRPEQLYKDDFYAWTRDQGQALRRLAEQRWNGPLDLEHLAEEVEELGMQARNAVRSQLERVIEHLLKLEHSPAAEPRAGWMNSVDDARARTEDAMTPTIRRETEPLLSMLYRRARRRVARDLVAQGEKEAARALPADCPYAFDDLIADDWWPVNRHGLRDDD
jgi:DNA-binding PucR family transcriptional regulator